MGIKLLNTVLPRRTVNLQANSGLADRAPTATWTVNGGTITANFTPGPDHRGGAVQAARWTEANGASGEQIYSDTKITLTGTVWRQSVYLKPFGPSKRFLTFGLTDLGGNYTNATFDLGTGIAISPGSETGYATIRNDSRRLANGWFRFSTYATAIAGSASIFFQMGDTAANAYNNGSYTGDGISSALIWGIDTRPATEVLS